MGERERERERERKREEERERETTKSTSLLCIDKLTGNDGLGHTQKHTKSHVISVNSLCAVWYVHAVRRVVLCVCVGVCECVCVCECKSSCQLFTNGVCYDGAGASL